MDKATLLFSGVMLLFCLRGFFLGFPRVLVRLTALAAGYAAAILGTPTARQWLQQQTPLDGLGATLGAMAGLFLLTGFAVSGLGTLVIHLADIRDSRLAGRLGGAGLNSLFGAAVGVIVVWMAGLAYGALHPDGRFSDSRVQHLADRAMAHVFGQVALRQNPDNPEQARVIAQIAAHPTETVQDLRHLANSGDLRSLLQSPETQAMLRRGDAEAVTQSAPFQTLSEEGRFRAVMTRSGLVDPDLSPEEQDAAIADWLSDLWQGVEAVRLNPEFRAIVDDPDFQEQLRSGNVWQLLNDPRSEALVELVQGAEPTASAAAPDTDTDAPDTHAYTPSDTEPVQSTPVHRWRDSEGNWHFSDEAPPDGTTR